MSAMHWEARRRQSVVDRRTARDKQQLLQDFSGSGSKATADSYTIEQQAAVSQCPQCQGNLRSPVQYRAKIPNRYSSVQYSQQW